VFYARYDPLFFLDIVAVAPLGNRTWTSLLNRSFYLYHVSLLLSRAQDGFPLMARLEIFHTIVLKGRNRR
jgi:hypothetical protein